MIICFRLQQILLCLKNLISVICYVGEKIRAVINFVLFYLISCFEYKHMHSMFLVTFSQESASKAERVGLLV